jgi:hypothetical protein
MRNFSAFSPVLRRGPPADILAADTALAANSLRARSHFANREDFDEF